MSGEVTTPRAEEHLGLVHLCANRFRNRGIDYDELYSAGCVGLLKAVKAFDCTRGVQFSTYAVPAVSGRRHCAHQPQSAGTGNKAAKVTGNI